MSLIRKQLGHLLATPIGKVPPGPKGSVKPAPARADSSPRSRDDEVTKFHEGVVATSALPFVPGAVEAAGVNAGPVQTEREKPARPDLAIASRDDDEMTAVGSASPPSAPALPFGPGSPGAPPSNRSPEARPLPLPLPPPKRSSLGSTEEERPSPFRANPLPFRSANTNAPAAAASGPEPTPAPDADTIPVLSLEQYASLCAELFVFPGNPEVIFLKYRLRTQGARSAVDSYWQRRLSKDVSLYRRWQELYRQYTAYWQSRR